MALFGTYTVIAGQVGQFPLFVTAMDHLRLCFTKGTPEHQQLAALADGETVRTELGAGVHAIAQAYRTRLRADAFYESHRQHIDVQAIVEGEEIIEVADVGRLCVAQPYAPDRDFVKYAFFDFGSRLRLGPGDLAILFPPDGHMPCVATGEPALVRKVVVKVPVAGPAPAGA